MLPLSRERAVPRPCDAYSPLQGLSRSSHDAPHCLQELRRRWGPASSRGCGVSGRPHSPEGCAQEALWWVAAGGHQLRCDPTLQKPLRATCTQASDRERRWTLTPCVSIVDSTQEHSAGSCCPADAVALISDAMRRKQAVGNIVTRQVQPFRCQPDSILPGTHPMMSCAPFSSNLELEAAQLRMHQR